MGLLLDTHAFIWFYSGNDQLSKNALSAIDESKGDFYISMASFWEITIKHGLGKLDLVSDLDELLNDVLSQGYRILPIHFSHLSTYNQLPLLHRDPFDRLIIAQALTEGMDIVSKDGNFDPYIVDKPVKRLW